MREYFIDTRSVDGMVERRAIVDPQRHVVYEIKTDGFGQHTLSITFNERNRHYYYGVDAADVWRQVCEKTLLVAGMDEFYVAAFADVERVGDEGEADDV